MTISQPSVSKPRLCAAYNKGSHVIDMTQEFSRPEALAHAVLNEGDVVALTRPAL